MPRIQNRSFPLVLLIGFILAGVAVSPARAGFMVEVASVTPENVGFRWNFEAHLDTNTAVQSGDFFTIYDFAGALPITNTQPSNWSFTMPMTGKNAPFTNPPDDPTIPNLTWQYQGNNNVLGSVTSTLDFSVLSQSNGAIPQIYGSQSHNVVNGRVEAVVSTLEVPSTNSPSPEPATIFLLGAGLPFLGGIVALRRRKRLAN